MKLVFASDSFKGTLTSAETAGLLERAARDVLGGSVVCVPVPMADGGEGTVEAIVAATGGQYLYAEVQAPLGNRITARYGCTGSGIAVIEMAAASGLTLVPENKRDPRMTSSRGTGDLIRDALDRGFRDICITVGGSATNDGGIGCMKSLGARFLGADGHGLKGIGRNLSAIHDIDISFMDPRIRSTRFTVLCDVTNPLCSENGATYVYGPQKGADAAICAELEAGMQNYRQKLISLFGIDPDRIPGSGAAGGLGAALMLFLDAEYAGGAGKVMDLCGFDSKASDADLVITGEGRADAQSCCGKVVSGIGARCKALGVPAVALVGSRGEGSEKLLDCGISRIFTVCGEDCTEEQSMADPEGAYLRAARKMFMEL